MLNYIRSVYDQNNIFSIIPYFWSFIIIFWEELFVYVKKMGMYAWSIDKKWQDFGMDKNVGNAFILKLTEDESKIKSLNRVKPKQTLCRESESSVFYTDNPSEKILRCGGCFRTFIFNTKTSSFSYSDYTLKSLYRLWLGECNKI